MDAIIQAVEQFRSLPDSFVDTSFAQGLEAVQSGIMAYNEDQDDHPRNAAKFMAAAPAWIAELTRRVAPAQLPKDYIFFLEFYGGLSLYVDQSWLMINGIGPMVEQEYGFVVWGDNALYENGLLLIGHLSSNAYFFLDLTDIVQQYAVIGIPSKTGSIDLQAVLLDIRSKPETWTKLANSFTTWLEGIAQTKGKLVFI